MRVKSGRSVVSTLVAAFGLIVFAAPSAWAEDTYYTLTVTPAVNATYTATTNGQAVTFSGDSAQIIDGSTVSFTATASGNYTYGTAPTDWTGTGTSVTRGVTVSGAETAVTIPDPDAALAKIGEVMYTSLADAVTAANAAAEAQTITLLANQTVSTDLTVENNALTLALDAYQLTIADGVTFTLNQNVTVTRDTATTAGILNLGSIVIAAEKVLNMDGFVFGAGIIDTQTGSTTGTFAIKAGAEVILGSGLTPLAMESVNSGFFTGTESGGKFTSGTKTYVHTGTEWPVWAGAGTAESPYEIASKGDLDALQANISTYKTAFFKQVEDIDFDNAEWTGISTVNSSYTPGTDAFQGVYNGNGKTIENIVYDTGSYGGFFNYLYNATVSNLTIKATGRKNNTGGSGILSGMMLHCYIQDVTTDGALTGTHHCDGFAVKAISTTFVNCLNKANLSCAKDTGKVSGFVGFQSSDPWGTLVFINCENRGSITYTYATPAIRGGAAGFVGWDDGSSTIAFTNCVNNGVITATAGGYAGSFIGFLDNCGANATHLYPVTASGCTSSQIDTLAIATNYDAKSGTVDLVPVSGLNFATVSGSVVTFIDTPVNGCKVMVPGAPYEFTKHGQTLTLDESIAAANVTAASYLNLTENEGVYSATAKEIADIWSGRGTGTAEDPYLIADKTDLMALKAVADANKATSGLFWKQTADITLSGVWGGIATFAGSYDGGNNTISGLLLPGTNGSKRKGLFTNLTSGSVVKNLTISWDGFENAESTLASDQFGGGAVVGIASAAIISNVTVNATKEICARHNVAGVASRTADGTTIIDCVNNANIKILSGDGTGDAGDGKICGFSAQCDGTSTVQRFINCVNNGSMTVVGDDVHLAGSQGVGGILGYVGKINVELIGCVNNGAIVIGATADSALYGSMIGRRDASKYVVTIGANNTTTNLTVPAYGDNKDIPGLNFATVSGDPAVATFTTPAVGGSFKVMSSNAVFTNFTALGQTITLDETLATATVGTQLGDAYTATKSGNVYTCEMADPIDVTVTVQYATYTVKDGEIALPQTQVPTGKSVTYTATPYAGFEYTAGSDGWVLADGKLTKSFTDTAAVTIPTPTVIPPAVQIADKNGYTNLTFTIKAPAAGSYTITAKDIETGATVGWTTVTFDEAGSQAVDVATDQFTGGTGFVVGKTYTYTVASTDATPVEVGTTTFSDVAWKTNGYFGASATTGSPVFNNGTWDLNAPEISNNKFAIDSTQTVFKITDVQQSNTRKIVTLDTEIDVASYYYLDDITNDVTSGIAALALVTNEEAAADAAWMVLTKGNTWTKMDGPNAIGAYTTRVELDYNTATPRVRYSVKPETTGLWQVLTKNNTEWFDAQANYVSNVCFIGKADVAEFSAELSTKALAEYDGDDYTDFLEAMAAAKESGTALVLYTNIQIDPRTLIAGTYKVTKNGKNIIPNYSDWKKSDGEKTELIWDGDTLTVVKTLFVVAIDETCYTTLQDAFDAAANGTIVVLTNVAQCATSTVANAVIDLDGFTLTKGTANKPVIVVTGAEATLYAFNGVVADATEGVAFSATNGAALYLADLFVTNNTTAVEAGAGATVTISNGCFSGAFVTDSGADTKINILGGFLVAKTPADLSFVGTSGITAIGGRLTETTKTTVDTAEIMPEAYKFADFIVQPETNGYVFVCEIMTNIVSSGSEEVPTKTFVITNDVGEAEGTVQLPDAFVAETAKAAGASILPPESDAVKTQEFMNADAPYGRGLKRWECYVLGITNTETTTEGPYVKGVQDSKSGTIGFNVLTPAAIKAAESGCDVKFEVEEFSDPELKTTTGKSTGSVDYSKTAEIEAPTTGVRYYKLKMTISPKK